MCRVLSQTPENEKKKYRGRKSLKFLLYENYRLFTRPIDSELCAPLDLLLAKIALDLYISLHIILLGVQNKIGISPYTN